MILSIATLIIVVRMRRALAAAIAAAAATAVLHAQDRPAELAAVLERAGRYVGEYQEGLRGIVAEETYLQSHMTTRRGRMVREGRQLKADLLLVKLPSEERWMQFRDVFEVDRRPVRDRDERLYKLFVEAKPDARTEAEAIQTESARYNLGPVFRNINIPVLGLYFFEKSFAPGIQYAFAKPGNVKRFAGLAPAESIVLVEFKETGPGTAIRGTQNRDMPSHGKAWIDSSNGRILHTEFTSQDTSLSATIYVTYKSEAGLPVLVPEEMREIYTMQRGETRIDGRAKYGRFRQFTVTTTEKPKP
jgi:hypothetical protein